MTYVSYPRPTESRRPVMKPLQACDTGDSGSCMKHEHRHIKQPQKGRIRPRKTGTAVLVSKQQTHWILTTAAVWNSRRGLLLFTSTLILMKDISGGVPSAIYVLTLQIGPRRNRCGGGPTRWNIFTSSMYQENNNCQLDPIETRAFRRLRNKDRSHIIHHPRSISS